MCCLAFENDYYAEVNMAMPKINSSVKVISDGKELLGTVIGVNQLKLLVRVRTMIKEDTYEINDYPLEQVLAASAQPAKAVEEEGDKEPGAEE